MAYYVVSTRKLRYALTLHLRELQTAATISDLVAAMRDANVEVLGRPSKTISDALRTEVARGRVIRCGRGVYRAGSMPESTGRFIRRWVAEH